MYNVEKDCLFNKTEIEEIKKDVKNITSTFVEFTYKNKVICEALQEEVDNCQEYLNKDYRTVLFEMLKEVSNNKLSFEGTIKELCNLYNQDYSEEDTKWITALAMSDIIDYALINNKIPSTYKSTFRYC